VCDNYKKPSKETSPAPLTEDGVLANEILNFFITNTKIYFIESEKGERISTFTKKRKKKDKKSTLITLTSGTTAATRGESISEAPTPLFIAN
jgi:hypothetical protein